MKRTKIGDVFELENNGVYVYFQITHKNELMGDLIRIVKRRFSKPCHDPSIFSEGGVDSTFFPVAAVYSDGFIRRVGNFEVCKRLKPFPLFQTGIVAPEIGLTQSIKIWDGENTFEPTPTMSPVESLPRKQAIMFPVLKQLASDYPLK